jgi:hypothetical protein
VDLFEGGKKGTDENRRSDGFRLPCRIRAGTRWGGMGVLAPINAYVSIIFMKEHRSAYLVDGGYDLGCLEEQLEVLDGEVGDSDRPHFT